MGDFFLFAILFLCCASSYWIQNNRIKRLQKLNDQHLDRLKTLDELNERLIERNEELEPSARLLDQDDTPVLQDCKRDAKL